MPEERKHVGTIEGELRPDIFQPHRLGVEVFADMDDIFAEARRIAAGELPPAEGHESSGKFVKGQHSVAIVTPGRLIMVDACPEPSPVLDEKVASIRELMPPDPPLKITVISYTFIEALVQNIDKAIPFRGIINGWAYLGHNVILFEGHVSAFESGVRDSDVLLVDSGMIPFLPSNWIPKARRVMNQNGRIFIHDRPTYSLGLVTTINEEGYAHQLLTYLIRSDRSSVVLNSGHVVPDLAELTNQPNDLQLIATLAIDREKLNTDGVIDYILRKAGWPWYRPFKKQGALKMPAILPDGRQAPRGWEFKIRLNKDAAGNRQLEIER